LPEPQADYFEHPTVRKSSFNPNSYNTNTNNNNNQSFLNANRDFGSGAGAGGFMTPNPFLLPPGVVVGGTGQQPEITQSQLRPLQSLDARVLKQFRALEQKDPRFKRRVMRSSHTANTIASGASGAHGANFMTRFISPGGTEYNYSQI
jgi:hypothetical protein